MHEFGWKADDYDRLAAGSLVGHILECGPQSTGGTFTDWEEVPDWHNIGYPIAECAPMAHRSHQAGGHRRTGCAGIGGRAGAVRSG